MSPADLARRLVAVALAAVDPERLVREHLGGSRSPGGPGAAPRQFAAVLAIGKAAPAMARGARAHLAPSPRRLLVRPHGVPGLLDPVWEQLSGGHPLPDKQSLGAGARVLRWLGELSPGAPLLALISGGASACVEAPAPGLALEDLVVTQRCLLASGRPIGEINAARKHLSAFKGGGALRATRAQVLALLLSDVPGDDPATIASGPFAADPATFAGALAAVSGLAVPERVREHLAAGARGELPETLKAGDPALSRVETALIGNVGTAAVAAATESHAQGYATRTGELSGEARVAARELVALGRSIPGPAVALVLGGETTVTLEGSPGQGGRNLELALAAARELDGGVGELVMALATDGEDGPTRYAGAMVDGETWGGMQAAGIDPARALARHDSQRALGAVAGALIETGPTGTNVGDLAIYLRLTPPH